MIGLDQAASLRDEAGGHRMRGRRERAPGAPLFLAVTSGKGGVGKSQVAANLGVHFASQDLRVLLVDADLGLASLDLLLGVSPERDLLDVVRGRATAREVIIEGPSGVHLLPACPGRYEMANLGAAERARLRDAITDLAPLYDVVVVDTGAGIGSNALDFATLADEILLVTTPDPSSLRDSYAMTKVLSRRAGIARVWMICNQVASERDGEGLHRRLDELVGRFLPVELRHLGSLPRERAVTDAVAAGEPFVLRAPRSHAARAVVRLAARLRQSIASDPGAIDHEPAEMTEVGC